MQFTQLLWVRPAWLLDHNGNYPRSFKQLMKRPHAHHTQHLEDSGPSCRVTLCRITASGFGKSAGTVFETKTKPCILTTVSSLIYMTKCYSAHMWVRAGRKHPARDCKGTVVAQHPAGSTARADAQLFLATPRVSHILSRVGTCSVKDT